ncbi:hypothetical protein KIPB_005016 [Kipferlia bialata]|uniref:Uncharacterized protein n=1 Tax=Kipferlia bialata TaxID=797122 RepID=A0A9K3CWD8_9EUKA|nr:hypothetical protein KIPB_005016 [Kipferlia bialata]|eukprot:g5016.t1
MSSFYGCACRYSHPMQDGLGYRGRSMRRIAIYLIVSSVVYILLCKYANSHAVQSGGGQGQGQGEGEGEGLPQGEDTTPEGTDSQEEEGDMDDIDTDHDPDTDGMDTGEESDTGQEESEGESEESEESEEGEETEADGPGEDEGESEGDVPEEDDTIDTGGDAEEDTEGSDDAVETETGSDPKHIVVVGGSLTSLVTVSELSRRMADGTLDRDRVRVTLLTGGVLGDTPHDRAEERQAGADKIGLDWLPVPDTLVPVVAEAPPPYYPCKYEIDTLPASIVDSMRGGTPSICRYLRTGVGKPLSAVPIRVEEVTGTWVETLAHAFEGVSDTATCGYIEGNPRVDEEEIAQAYWEEIEGGPQSVEIVDVGDIGMEGGPKRVDVTRGSEDGRYSVLWGGDSTGLEADIVVVDTTPTLRYRTHSDVGLSKSVLPMITVGWALQMDPDHANMPHDRNYPLRLPDDIPYQGWCSIDSAPGARYSNLVQVKCQLGHKEYSSVSMWDQYAHAPLAVEPIYRALLEAEFIPNVSWDPTTVPLNTTSHDAYLQTIRWGSGQDASSEAERVTEGVGSTDMYPTAHGSVRVVAAHLGIAVDRGTPVISTPPGSCVSMIQTHQVGVTDPDILMMPPAAVPVGYAIRTGAQTGQIVRDMLVEGTALECTGLGF